MKTDAQIAVEAFDAADQAYKQYETLLSSGNVILAMFEGQDLQHLDPAKLVLQYQMIWAKARELLEDRNAKLKSAKDALRQAVVLGPTQRRGPDGKATIIEQGDFKVSSVTSRSFNTEFLLHLLEKNGKLEEVKGRTKRLKDGDTVHILRQEWVVEYEDILSFLKANQLKEVIDGAYAEYEKTPAVTGPKELAFLGDKKTEK
jgi:hypothetical protein